MFVLSLAFRQFVRGSGFSCGDDDNPAYTGDLVQFEPTAWLPDPHNYLRCFLEKRETDAQWGEVAYVLRGADLISSVLGTLAVSPCGILSPYLHWAGDFPVGL